MTVRRTPASSLGQQYFASVVLHRTTSINFTSYSQEKEKEKETSTRLEHILNVQKSPGTSACTPIKSAILDFSETLGTSALFIRPTRRGQWSTLRPLNDRFIYRSFRVFFKGVAFLELSIGFSFFCLFGLIIFTPIFLKLSVSR